MPMEQAEDFIARFQLEPLKPEGGWFRRSWLSAFSSRSTLSSEDVAPTVSVIYYLLKKGEVSQWHRLRSHEVWAWHAGGTLEMTFGGFGEKPVPSKKRTCGCRPNDDGYILPVPAKQWQTARVVDGDFVLVSCIVSPAFQEKDCQFWNLP